MTDETNNIGNLEASSNDPVPWADIKEAPFWLRRSCELLIQTPDLDVVALAKYVGRQHHVQDLLDALQEPKVIGWMEDMRVDRAASVQDVVSDITMLRAESLSSLLEKVQKAREPGCEEPLDVDQLLRVWKASNDYHPDREFVKMERRETQARSPGEQKLLTRHMLETLKERAALNMPDRKQVEGEVMNE